MRPCSLTLSSAGPASSRSEKRRATLRLRPPPPFPTPTALGQRLPRCPGDDAPRRAPRTRPQASCLSLSPASLPDLRCRNLVSCFLSRALQNRGYRGMKMSDSRPAVSKPYCGFTYGKQISKPGEKSKLYHRQSSKSP